MRQGIFAYLFTLLLLLFWPSTAYCAPKITGTVSGTIMDAATYTPLAGATVNISFKMATTNGRGKYSIPNVNVGTATITVKMTGYKTFMQVITVYTGQSLLNVYDIYLQQESTAKTGTVAGTVTDAITQSPVVGANVIIGTKSGITNSTGKYSIDNLPVGNNSISISYSGYLPYNQQIAVYEGQSFLNIYDISLQKEIIVPENSANGITITAEEDAVDYPLQIARPFLPGEIPNYPQAVVGSAGILTQADVKCRWPDGSVRHAILSFVIPSITKGSPFSVSFVNQESGNNSAFETKDRMLSDYNFDAVIKIQGDLASNQIASASARQMLQSDHFSYWTQGSVCTTIILADHSANAIYDMGFPDANGNNYRALRPIFHASFWPTLKKVSVRYIGELSNTEKLQGFWTPPSGVSISPSPYWPSHYDLTLLLGYSSPAVVYTKAYVQHRIMTRWTKKFWMGTTPPALSINHNLKYLASTKMVSNYDTSIQIPEEEIANQYYHWSKPETKKEIFDPGNWTKAMPTTGGRPDIGPYPDWVIQWLYTGDRRLWEKAAGNAELAGGWQGHIREGKTDRFFDSAKQVNALGKVLSVYARPSIMTDEGYLLISCDSDTNKAGDRIEPKEGVRNPSWPGFWNDGWVFQPAHCPDPFSALYLLTGDFWYLEELYFWAAYQAGHDHPVRRGPTLAGAGISTEVRGQAWLFRIRARVAALAPDNTQEKSYFTKLTEDLIAIWEGERNITGTSYEGSINWSWANTTAKGWVWDSCAVPSSLCFWYPGSEGHVNSDSVMDYTQSPPKAFTKRALSPWEIYFMLFSLGQARDLGFKTDALLYWTGKTIVDAINGLPSPYYMVASRMPTINLSNSYFSSIEELKNGYNPLYDYKLSYDYQVKDAVHGYPNIMIPAVAAAYDAGVPGASTAWNWILTHTIPDSGEYTKRLPKWRIFPRTP